MRFQPRVPLNDRGRPHDFPAARSCRCSARRTGVAGSAWPAGDQRAVRLRHDSGFRSAAAGFLRTGVHTIASRTDRT